VRARVCDMMPNMKSSCRQGAMAGLVAFIIMLIMAPAQIMKRMGAGPFVWRARQPLW